MYFQTTENVNDHAVPETDLFCQRIQQQQQQIYFEVSRARARLHVYVCVCMRAIEQYFVSFFFCTQPLYYG